MGLFNLFKGNNKAPKNNKKNDELRPKGDLDTVEISTETKTENNLITIEKHIALMNFFIKYKILFVIIGIILLSSIWLVAKGLNHSHDVGFHMGRIKGLSTTIEDGNFLAQIYNYFYGHGYAMGLFYSNFYFYVPAVLSILLSLIHI